MTPQALRLFDLRREILFKLFRDYVSLHDKLHVLFDVREFRTYLENRESYLSGPLPFSTEYLALLRDLRPGWYVSRTNWNHRFRLQIDERTLRFSLYHFVLQGYEEDHRLNARCTFVGADTREMRIYLRHYFHEFRHAEEEFRLLYYHLEGHGFIAVDFTFPDSPLHSMRFYDGTFCTIRVDEKREMSDRIATTTTTTTTTTTHFAVLLKSSQQQQQQHRLVVECTLHSLVPRLCQCETRVRELNPIPLDDRNVVSSSTYRALTWSDGEEGRGGEGSVHLTVRQEFRLSRKEENRVKAGMMYHIDYALDHAAPFEKTKKINENVKRLLLEEEEEEEPPRKKQKQ